MTETDVHVTNAPKGAALLDLRWPDYKSEIDASRLDMNNIRWCILGQLFGSFYDGMLILFGDQYENATIREREVLAGGFGFDVMSGQSYDPLEAHWVAILEGDA